MNALRLLLVLVTTMLAACASAPPLTAKLGASTYTCSFPSTAPGGDFTVGCSNGSAPTPPLSGCPAGQHAENGVCVPDTPAPTPVGCTEGPFNWYGSLGVSGKGNDVGSPTGAITSLELPSPATSTGQVIQTESTNGPRHLVTIEQSISQCRGYMPPTAGPCYQSSQIGTTNSLQFFRSVPAGYTAAQLVSYGYCDATAAGAWYFNVRYTYTDSPPNACGRFPNCSFITEWYNGFTSMTALRKFQKLVLPK